MRFVILLLGTLLLSSVTFADVNDTIPDSIDQQKEDGLEADDTAMEIHDLEAEQQLAREQARAQEQMKAAAEKRLKKVQAQKANVDQKLKLDIMMSEARRKKAESETAVIKKEVQILQAKIKALEISRDKADKAAADAKAVTEAGRETLHELQVKKAQAEQQNRKAQADNRKAQAELAALRAESKRLKTASNSK